MPNRLIRLFLLAASLSVSGAAVVALSGNGLNAFPNATIASPAHESATVAQLSTTLMPTVVVRPEVRVPTLATVTVRPNRVELALVSSASANGGTDVFIPLLARRPAAGLMASAGFDMPYYSFGKTLRHVSKE